MIYLNPTTKINPYNYLEYHQKNYFKHCLYTIWYRSFWIWKPFLSILHYLWNIGKSKSVKALFVAYGMKERQPPYRMDSIQVVCVCICLLCLFVFPLWVISYMLRALGSFRVSGVFVYSNTAQYVVIFIFKVYVMLCY